MHDYAIFNTNVEFVIALQLHIAVLVKEYLLHSLKILWGEDNKIVCTVYLQPMLW